MIFGTLLTAILLSVTNLTITEPVNGETYDGDWLPLRAIVENENEIPDSVHYSLNGQLVIQIPRLNTDWYTYMANDCRTGYSESLAPYDNTILWTAPISGTYHEFVSPVVVDGRVYYASEEDEIAYCLDAATGAEIWRFENIGDAIDDAMCVRDGMVYLASDSIWCLDALTGDRIWAFGNDAPYGFSGSPVPYQQRVYVYSYFIVYCLDDLTGEEIWRTDSLFSSTGCMTAWNGMLFHPTYLGSGSHGYMYALDTFSGDILWVADGFGSFWDSSPVLVDSTLYIGDCGSEANLYAIDPFDGSSVALWGPFDGAIESTPAVYADRIFFGAYPLIYCVNRFTGDVEWEFNPPDNDFLHASCGVADDLVFWGDASYPDSVAFIHAVDIQTGTEVWSYPTYGGPLGIQSSPAIVDGVMYIAATDGNLYAFGTGFKYTYREDYFYADIGSNELIVTSFDGGAAVAADTINFTVTQTGITLEPSSRLALCASPNPFYSAASISFELSEPGWTLVTVYDLSGRIVRTLESSELGAGQYSIVWDGRIENGEPVSAGLYLCRIQSGGVTETTGLCLLR